MKDNVANIALAQNLERIQVHTCLFSKSAAQKGSAGAPYICRLFPSIFLADLTIDPFRPVFACTTHRTKTL